MEINNLLIRKMFLEFRKSASLAPSGGAGKFLGIAQPNLLGALNPE